ncbi:hypothetical protein LLH00_07935 [bacterium]|nr:hypothetical protein [bacterium]
MKVGILEFRDTNGRYLKALQAYETILEHNGIACERLSPSDPSLLERVRGLDLFIARWGLYDHDRQLVRSLLPAVEEQLGVKCFPDRATCWHYDDKIGQWYLMQARGFPMVDTRVFWERRAALGWLEREAEYPQVFKLTGGAGSQNVLLVRDAAQGKRLVRRMFGRGILPGGFLPGGVRLAHFNLYRELRRAGGDMLRRLRGLDASPWWVCQKNYALFQRFLPGNEWDTRVTVIGGRAFAFRRLVRPGDFRASGSGRIDYDPAGVDPLCVQIALRASRELGFQSMAYDFLFDPAGGPCFCEISYTYVSRAVYDCPGWWDRDHRWHAGHLWPEWCQLADCLSRPDLKAPDLSGLGKF